MAPSFDERTETFLQWFKALPGASFSDSIKIVDLRDRDAGRGIVAIEDIPPETTLFTISRRVIINAETSELPKRIPAVFGAGDDEQVDDDDDGTQGLDSWASLILVLIYEYLQREKSPWKPYFDVLPSTFDTPMFWSEPELHELQASATRGKIGKAEAEDMFRTKLLPIFRSHANVFSFSGELNDEDFVALAHRMGSTIMAYAFDLEPDDDNDDEDEEGDGWVEDREERSMMGMVPMADILNADAEFNAHVNHGEDSLTVTALREIKAGEEILNYYGPHPNSELLRRYGYVTAKHAAYDVVEIPWAVVESALMAELKLSPETLHQVRERLDEDDLEDTFVIERDMPDPSPDGTLPPLSHRPAITIPADLQAQLRHFLKAIATASSSSSSSIPDKRKRDELQASVLARALRDVMAGYATTAAEDELLLHAGPGVVGGRRRMAVLVRVGEKRLLAEVLAALAGEDGLEDGRDVGAAAKRVKRSG